MAFCADASYTASVLVQIGQAMCHVTSKCIFVICLELLYTEIKLLKFYRGYLYAVGLGESG